MPLTAGYAGVLLRAGFAGDSLVSFTATKVGLETSATVPTATAAGTAISGDPRVGPATWSSAGTAGAVTSISNVDAFSFTSMPAVTSPGVRYIGIYDSAGSPTRKAYGQLSADRVTVSGDTLTFSAGSLSIGLVSAIGSTPST